MTQSVLIYGRPFATIINRSRYDTAGLVETARRCVVAAVENRFSRVDTFMRAIGEIRSSTTSTARDKLPVILLVNEWFGATVKGTDDGSPASSSAPVVSGSRLNRSRRTTAARTSLIKTQSLVDTRDDRAYSMSLIRPTRDRYHPLIEGIGNLGLPHASETMRRAIVTTLLRILCGSNETPYEKELSISIAKKVRIEIGTEPAKDDTTPLDIAYTNRYRSTLVDRVQRSEVMFRSMLKQLRLADKRLTGLGAPSGRVTALVRADPGLAYWLDTAKAWEDAKVVTPVTGRSLKIVEDTAPETPRALSADQRVTVEDWRPA